MTSYSARRKVQGLQQTVHCPLERPPALGWSPALALLCGGLPWNALPPSPREAADNQQFPLCPQWPFSRCVLQGVTFLPRMGQIGSEWSYDQAGPKKALQERWNREQCLCWMHTLPALGGGHVPPHVLGSDRQTTKCREKQS